MTRVILRLTPQDLRREEDKEESAWPINEAVRDAITKSNRSICFRSRPIFFFSFIFPTLSHAWKRRTRGSCFATRFIPLASYGYFIDTAGSG